jgi:hypothetical protein
VHSILQIQGKTPEQSSKSPVNKTPRQFEKIYKQKTTGLSSKITKTEEERSTKRQKIAILTEEEDHEL